DVYVISRAGEGALVEVVRALKADADLSGIANIAYREAAKPAAEADGAVAARARAWVEAHPQQAAALRARGKRAASYRRTQTGEEDHPLETTRIDYALFPR